MSNFKLAVLQFLQLGLLYFEEKTYPLLPARHIVKFNFRLLKSVVSETHSDKIRVKWDTLLMKITPCFIGPEKIHKFLSTKVGRIF